MTDLRPYRRKQGNQVLAIQLALHMEGFAYEKWGGRQWCKAGDWIVCTEGEVPDVYTVDRETFERTYRRVGRGIYEKHSRVWAKVAVESGTIATKEGSTDYERGDYIVFNDPQGVDGYAVSRDRFHELYEPDPTPGTGGG